MLMTALLLLHLGAVGDLSDEAELRGELPPVSVEDREALRLRGAIHFAVAGGFSGFAPGGGPGLSAELGATFADRYSLSLRATVATLLMVSNVMGGLAFDFALSERFSLGVALSLGVVGGVFVFDTPLSVATYLPVRATFAPFGRERDQVPRKGLALFAEVGPGYGLVMSPGRVLFRPPMPSPMSFIAAIGVGYAVW